MQHKFIFSFRQIILIAILLAPVYSFSQANKTGITIIIVTHEHDSAAMTERTIRLKDGIIENENVKEPIYN